MSLKLEDWLSGGVTRVIDDAADWLGDQSNSILADASSGNLDQAYAKVYTYGYYSFYALAALGSIAGAQGSMFIGGLGASVLKKMATDALIANAVSFPTFDASPTYGWNPTTLQQQGIPVPRIYGQMQVPGNIISADGMLYLYGENGEIVLAKPELNSFRKISSFKVPYGESQHWAHPVIHNGRLFVRHGNSLMVYDLRK